MRLNFKKSMLAAGVLAALIAGSAFAATPEQDAAMQNQGHMYNNRVEQGAVKTDDASMQRQGHMYNKIVEQRAVQTEDAATRQSGVIKSKDGGR